MLVVDDDDGLRRMVRAVLERDGHRVLEAADGVECLRIVHNQRPDAVVLDVSLPNLDGWDALRRIRDVTSTPVLMLTARDGEADIVRALREGADDYVTKPFRNAELAARVSSVLRRVDVPGSANTRVATPGRRVLGALEIDVDRREVWVHTLPVSLTPREYDVLSVLVGNPSRVFTRDELLHRVWGRDWFGDDHLVDVTISKLRAKLGDDARNPRFIETVRGVGFRIFLTPS